MKSGMVGKTTAATRSKASDKNVLAPPPAARGKRGSLVIATQVYGGSPKAPVLSGSASKSGGMQMRATGSARPAALDVAKQLLKAPSRSATSLLPQARIWAAPPTLEHHPSCTPRQRPSRSQAPTNMAHFVASNPQVKGTFKGKSGAAVAQPVEGAGLAVPPVVPPQLIPTILWPPVGRAPHRLLAALCIQHEPRSRAGPKGGLPSGQLYALLSIPGRCRPRAGRRRVRLARARDRRASPTSKGRRTSCTCSTARCGK